MKQAEVCVHCLFDRVQAVCCSDHVHCCPSNTECDLEHDVCKSGETAVPQLKKISAARVDSKQCIPDVLFNLHIKNSRRAACCV